MKPAVCIPLKKEPAQLRNGTDDKKEALVRKENFRTHCFRNHSLAMLAEVNSERDPPFKSSLQYQGCQSMSQMDPSSGAVASRQGITVLRPTFVLNTSSGRCTAFLRKGLVSSSINHRKD